MMTDPQPGDIITAWNDRPRYVEDGDVVTVRDGEWKNGHVPVVWRQQYTLVRRDQIARWHKVDEVING